jgi:hypothetical protein
MDFGVGNPTPGKPDERFHSEEGSVNFETLLSRDRPLILDEAVDAVRRSLLEHYEMVGPDAIRARLDSLLGIVIEAARERNLAPMASHAGAVATERFEGGVALSEVQAAFNALEKTLWYWILKTIPAPEQAEALGLVGTVLGNGKDLLAQKYVSLAAQSHAPSLDLKALFAGSDNF